MLDPIIDFISRGFYWIGRGIGQVVAWLLWPFLALSQWYKKRSWLIKGPLAILLICLVALYAYFLFQSQVWRNFDPQYAQKYAFIADATQPGDKLAGQDNKCGPSAIVQVARDLTDFNVNQNQWMPSMLTYKLGLFGLEWKYTPFFDNKAAFQLGVNEIVRRTSRQLVDQLGRVRGTSQIDQNLQSARENIYYTEDFWYFSLSPFGPKSPTPTSYRSAVKNLDTFNTRLQACDATFDPRADNLLNFLDEMTSSLGSTSEILRGRIEASDAGWFDTRADDRFWFAYGQLYALSGILAAARSDFADTVRERNLERSWDKGADQLSASLGMQPLIISNGSESAFVMPSHLATMGFYVLSIRTNLTEIRAILDR